MLGSMILFVATGLLLAGMGVPMMRRRVGPNHLYGLRVRATFEDEWVWYEANARTGRDLLLLGVAQVALAVLLYALGTAPEAYALSVAAFLLVGTILLAVVGTVRANRLLRERRGGEAGR